MRVVSILLIVFSMAHCMSAPAPAEQPDTNTEMAIPKQAEINAAAASAVPGTSPARVPEDKNYLMGQFDPANRNDFVRVGDPYTDKSGMMLRKETFEAFKKMFEAARKDGISLKIISATRTFSQQKNIWEGKWTRLTNSVSDPVQRSLKILEYSAMPGASRHHWGTDIDLNDLNNASFEGNGKHAKVYDWMVAHAHEYDFGQPYTAKNEERPHGYNEEKWHWSYLPLSKKMLAEHQKIVADTDITGFKGAETAVALKISAWYVGGVNKQCK